MKKILLILAAVPALHAGEFKIINGEVYQKLEGAPQAAVQVPTQSQVSWDLTMWKILVGDAPYTPPSKYPRSLLEFTEFSNLYGK